VTGHNAAARGKAICDALSEDPEADNINPVAVPWPVLDTAAMSGVPGAIVNMLLPDTEADPAALLLTVLATFGATVNAPYVLAGNDHHRAILYPVIVGSTKMGAKGTGLSLVERILERANPAFYQNNRKSGLSSGEGLIEHVRDSTVPNGPDDNNFDPGVTDKRLLVIEREFRSVLTRSAKDGNVLDTTLRDAWDGKDLSTMTRKHNKLFASRPHIAVVGHITPDELLSSIKREAVAGGTVNRWLMCMSRRSRTHSRFGNAPEGTLTEAAKLFATAYENARHREEVVPDGGFWELWEPTYAQICADRPDNQVTKATARAPSQLLRLSLVYALMDGAEKMRAADLSAALALWGYCEASARWLFSTGQQEQEQSEVDKLAAFILKAGEKGRSRTEIYRDHYKSNIRAQQIAEQLSKLLHDGVIFAVEEKRHGRKFTRYVHRKVRIDVSTHYARQGNEARETQDVFSRTGSAEPGPNASEYVGRTYPKNGSDVHKTSNTSIRSLRTGIGLGGEPA
jgi:hypothetical protein